MSYQKVNVGEAIARGWRVFAGKLAIFSVVALVQAVLQLVVSQAIFEALSEPLFTGGNGDLIGINLWGILLPSIVSIVSIYVLTLLADLFFVRFALAGYGDDRRPTGRLLRDMLRRSLPFIGWGLLCSLMVFLAGIATLFTLCLGGLVVQVFVLFVPVFAYEGRQNPIWDSFRLSGRYMREVVVIIVVAVVPMVVATVALLAGAFFGLYSLAVGYFLISTLCALVWAFRSCVIVSFYCLLARKSLPAELAKPASRAA